MRNERKNMAEKPLCARERSDRNTLYAQLWIFRQIFPVVEHKTSLHVYGIL